MNLLQAGDFKVGLLVLSVGSIIGYMSMQVTDDPNLFGKSNPAWFVMPDAAGMVKGSQVKTAGIPVGVIKDIKLQDGQARVELALNPDLKLTVSASVMVKSAGILGDRYIEIKPGSESDPPLPPGGQILVYKDSGSLDSVIQQVGEISGSLKDVARILKESVEGDGTRKHTLGRIISNIERLTGDIADMTSANKNKISEIIDDVHGVTKTLDEVLNDPSDKGFKKRWKVALDRIDSTLKNIDEITGKVNRGEGTIGKLINDESTVEELNTAIDGINNFLDTAGKTQTGIDFNTQYLGNIGQSKTSVGLRLQPGLDRYYLLGIVDDPMGVVKTVDTATTIDGGSPTQTNTVTTYHNDLKFNAIFAKNFYNYTVRGGIMENSGGVGIDYYFMRNKMKFAVDALEFSKLNLRAYLQYNIWKGIYVVGGTQDIFNRGSKFSNYLGAGLLLTNDDLKMFLAKLPL